MPERIQIEVDGKSISVPRGITVAAALLNAGIPSRISVGGEARGPVCGMGICYECRVEIDGAPHQRGCMVMCQPKMKVRTL
jgi:sarcosine oxidase subunit alpha